MCPPCTYWEIINVCSFQLQDCVDVLCRNSPPPEGPRWGRFAAVAQSLCTGRWLGPRLTWPSLIYRVTWKSLVFSGAQRKRSVCSTDGPALGSRNSEDLRITRPAEQLRMHCGHSRNAVEAEPLTGARCQPVTVGPWARSISPAPLIKVVLRLSLPRGLMGPG